MDAVEYVKQRERMCSYYDSCDKCLANKVIGCATIEGISQMVPIVEQWAKEHPANTRQSEFLKQWPNAAIGMDGLLSVALCQLYFGLIHGESMEDCKSRKVCDKCRRDFWLKEIE